MTPESNAFTATLFDLIRRGYFEAQPVPAEDGSDGRSRQRSADLELRRGDQGIPLADFEKPVAKVFDEILAHGPMRLSRLGAHLEERPENVLRFQIFTRHVKEAIESRGWYTFTAARALLLASVGLLLVGMLGGWLLYSVSRGATFYLGASTIPGSGLLFHASWVAKLLRRRRLTATGRLETERWQAFRRYLTDFPRLRDAPAITLDLWERYLVYAIALGLAHRVLTGARLYRLEELSRSPIFSLGLSLPEGSEGGDAYAGFGPMIAPSRRSRLLAPSGGR